MSWGEIITAVNSEPFIKPLNELINETKDDIIKAGGGRQVFTANGTFTVPDGVTTIYVSAIAAGGNGYWTFPTSSGSGGGGGSSGQFAIDRPFNVTSGQSIPITVGTGNTVIGALLTLLKGTTPTDIFGSRLKGAMRGGNGGGSSGGGEDGRGSGGGSEWKGGGGGGGVDFFGVGGDGDSGNATGYGSGGGGAKSGSTGGGSGAPGIVIIEW